MKILKASLFILLAMVLFSSCQKEYSLEGVNTQFPVGSWQFKDSAILYVGNIDTAFLDSAGNTKSIHLIGKSAIGSEPFSLEFFTTGTFDTGIYRASLSEVQFNYFTATKTIYQADQLSGEFIVTITSLGNDKIVGTFSGLAVDSSRNIKELTLGKFSSTLFLNSGPTVAAGTLASDSGNCLPITPAGTYTQGVALTASNTVQVQVNVTTPGTYNISTNIVNGVSFSGTGTFTNTGSQNVTLTGTGTPTDSSDQNFTVTFNSSVCNFSINFLAGTAPQPGTLGGAPGDCTPVTPAGTYTQGTALTASNTITIEVNVVALGAYTINTNTVDGISFSKSGNFTTAGTQNVVLTGTGTPINAGSQNFTVSYGSSTCNFSLDILPQGGSQDAVFTLVGSPNACTSAAVNGNYTASVALDPASNTVELQVNVTTTGQYSISTNTVNGIAFLALGTFTTEGIQTLTLKGSGIPEMAGTNTFTPQAGTSTCTFNVVTTAVDPSAAVYNCKIDGIFTSFSNRAVASTDDNGTPYLYLNGYTGPANGNTVPQLQIFINKNDGSPVTAGSYNVDGFLQPDGYRIEIDYKVENPDLSVTIWNTSSSLFSPNPPFTITITSITSTRVMGTFSGTLTNPLQGSTSQKVITEGVFDLPIQ